MYFEEEMEDFLMEKEINNASPATIEYYRRCLRRFADFIDEREISQKEVDKYKRELMRNIKPQSVNTYLRGLRTFVNFYEYPVKVKLVKEEKLIKEVYTESELKAILKKPPVKNFHIYKTWVIINFFLATGVRLSTLLDIRVIDINLESEMVMLRHNKNKQQQIIPMSKSLCKIMREYIIRRKGSGDDYLFPTASGTKADSRTIQRQIQKFNKSRGVDKHSIHLFRHTFATMYLRNGGDIYRLQKLMGHSSIKVTELYLHYTNEDLTDNYSKLNPLDTLTYKIK